MQTNLELYMEIVAANLFGLIVGKCFVNVLVKIYLEIHFANISSHILSRRAAPYVTFCVCIHNFYYLRHIFHKIKPFCAKIHQT